MRVRPHIGTSGWQYDDWRGVFYPDGVPQRDWLAFYAERFGTVEVNNSFYRLPERATFERWRDQTPPGFVLTVKASRFITHLKRLRILRSPSGSSGSERPVSETASDPSCSSFPHGSRWRSSDSASS